MPSRLLILAAASVAPLAAARPATARGKPPKPVEFAGDIGFVNTSGNTEVTTLTVNEKLVLNTGPWKLSQSFGTMFGKLKDSVNTSIWRAGLRGDRLFTERLGVFGLLNFGKNRVAGGAGHWEQGVGALVKAICKHLLATDRFFATGIQVTY